ncbi:hypothetical protein Y032_0127g1401 [Ancylostoma ceylanicum]|uniref:Uncharacterized protein n=1 Tax=Ancylostoma ceylanicum TaxID=53326 RepID=A0A016T880_9BILA|nr:hypothetical protein Y032_0127g1401 [Ancylostoma ceylanicum]
MWVRSLWAKPAWQCIRRCFRAVVEEVPKPIMTTYLQAVLEALWKKSTRPLWKNAGPPSDGSLGLAVV